MITRPSPSWNCQLPGKVTVTDCRNSWHCIRGRAGTRADRNPIAMGTVATVRYSARREGPRTSLPTSPKLDRVAPSPRPHPCGRTSRCRHSGVPWTSYAVQTKTLTKQLLIPSSRNEVPWCD